MPASTQLSRSAAEMGAINLIYAPRASEKKHKKMRIFFPSRTVFIPFRNLTSHNVWLLHCHESMGKVGGGGMREKIVLASYYEFMGAL